MSSDSPTPDVTPAVGDPGDDTARRFTYQWTYAAILVCSLFDDTLGVAEVFCEHHEDVLLKYDDGSYSGIQVKTRQVGSDPWKATDEPIFAAMCRFASLEHAFPGCFREFVLATNHTFLSGKKTKSDLPFLLSLAAVTADAARLPSKLLPLVKKISQRTGCAESVALTALKKCRCDHSLPKLDDVKFELLNTISESWQTAATTTYERLKEAADAVIAECTRASSLDHANCLPGYLSAMHTSQAVAGNAAIQGKRFNRARADQVLRESLATTALLVGPTSAPPPQGQHGTNRLERKLIAGGFSTVSINSAKDLRDKADYQSLEWIARLGDKNGLERREHIRSTVLRDCADAYETAKSGGGTFGITMRRDLRERLQHRRQSGHSTLFDCSDEHLEGYAYVLTGECKVWWSQPFSISEGE